MQVTIISDTSCLILLDKIGELDLLRKLYGEVIVTQVVAEEFGALLPDWIEIRNTSNNTIQLALGVTLDDGEASAIALALELEECLLIIDESKGRRFARQLGLTVTGTLGVLVQAKLKGHVVQLRPILDRIKQTDFRLSERLVQETLKELGE